MAVPQAPSAGSRRSRVLPVVRIASAGLLVGPGVSKFLTYDGSVEFFGSLGLPAAGGLVVVGIVELAAAGLLLGNRLPRVGASLVVPVTTVAAFTAGPTWQNVARLGMAVAVIGSETALGTDVGEESTG